MSELIPSPYRGLFYSPSFVPREQFSVSQIEKAFGSAHEPDRGCLRSWAYRYLAGLKEPEYTYEEACALPEHTPELAKLKGGVKKKTYGKVFHQIAERYYRGEPIDLSEDAANRFFSGSHLAPHPSQCVEIEIEKPIRVRTDASDLDGWRENWGGVMPVPRDEIAWSGFKDLVVRLPNSPRYLFDWKTTTPTVDNRRNRALGKPDGAWTWQKDAKAIRIDYQANLYAYDELVNYGFLPRGRWIYFANSGKPDARATDYEPDHELVLSTVRTLDGKARLLRELIRTYRQHRGQDIESRAHLAGQTEPNLANCAAFGGCPYRSSVGGPCTAEQSGVIPIGSLLKTVTRPEVKPREIGPSFTFEIGAHDMGLREEIEAAKQQRTQGQPPPASGFVPQGQPPYVPGYSANVGAPIPTAGMPPVFAAPTVAAPTAAPFDPSFAFGQQPAPAAPPAPQGAPWSPPAPPAPEPPPAPPQAALAPAPRPGTPPLGTATQNPEWVCDGNGGYLSKRDYEANCAAFGAPPAQEHFPSHVNPPEAAAPIPEAPKKRGPGRPKKAPEPVTVEERAAHVADQVAPSDFSEPELTVTLKLGRMVVSVPAPAELKETLQAYVLKAVGG